MFTENLINSLIVIPDALPTIQPHADQISKLVEILCIPDVRATVRLHGFCTFCVGITLKQSRPYDLRGLGRLIFVRPNIFRKGWFSIYPIQIVSSKASLTSSDVVRSAAGEFTKTKYKRHH